MTEVRIVLDAPISFDVGGRTIHSPMVEAAVGGVITRLILDTGSTAHVLTLDLASRAALDPREADAGTDHTGRRVPSWSLGTVAIEVSGVWIDLGDVQAIDGPPQFPRLGIGGFLSPQTLHEHATVVVDLARSRLVLVETSHTSLRSWMRSQFPAFDLLILERERGEGVRVGASIEPFEPVATMINTGTPETEFVRTAVPGLEGVRTLERGFGVTRTEVTGTTIAGHVLRVAGRSFPVETLFVRDERAPEHPDGQIGMDLLRGTVIAISPDPREPVVWMVPRA